MPDPAATTIHTHNFEHYNKQSPATRLPIGPSVHPRARENQWALKVNLVIQSEAAEDTVLGTKEDEPVLHYGVKYLIKGAVSPIFSVFVLLFHLNLLN